MPEQLFDGPLYKILTGPKFPDVDLKGRDPCNRLILVTDSPRIAIDTIFNIFPMNLYLSFRGVDFNPDGSPYGVLKMGIPPQEAKLLLDTVSNGTLFFEPSTTEYNSYAIAVIKKISSKYNQKWYWYQKWTRAQACAKKVAPGEKFPTLYIAGLRNALHREYKSPHKTELSEEELEILFKYIMCLESDVDVHVG